MVGHRPGSGYVQARKDVPRVTAGRQPGRLLVVSGEAPELAR